MYLLMKCGFSDVQSFIMTGLDAEGLYRVAGFHDDVEAIRMSFDKGNDQSDENWCYGYSLSWEITNEIVLTHHYFNCSVFRRFHL